MKNLKFLFIAISLITIFSSSVFGQDDIVIPEEDETFIPPPSSESSPPVILDESDSADVSDVEEYDG